MEEGIDEIKDYTASKEEDDEYDIIVDPTQSDEEEATASSSCKVQLLIELLDVFGNFSLEKYDPKTSDRLIMILRLPLKCT